MSETRPLSVIRSEQPFVAAVEHGAAPCSAVAADVSLAQRPVPGRREAGANLAIRARYRLPVVAIVIAIAVLVM